MTYETLVLNYSFLFQNIFLNMKISSGTVIMKFKKKKRTSVLKAIFSSRNDFL